MKIFSVAAMSAFFGFSQCPAAPTLPDYPVSSEQGAALQCLKASSTWAEYEAKVSTAVSSGLKTGEEGAVAFLPEQQNASHLLFEALIAEVPKALTAEGLGSLKQLDSDLGKIPQKPGGVWPTEKDPHPYNIFFAYANFLAKKHATSLETFKERLAERLHSFFSDFRGTNGPNVAYCVAPKQFVKPFDAAEESAFQATYTGPSGRKNCLALQKERDDFLNARKQVSLFQWTMQHSAMDNDQRSQYKKIGNFSDDKGVKCLELAPGHRVVFTCKGEEMKLDSQMSWRDGKLVADTEAAGVTIAHRDGAFVIKHRGETYQPDLGTACTIRCKRKGEIEKQDAHLLFGVKKAVLFGPERAPVDDYVYDDDMDMLDRVNMQR